jgi:3-oxoacyl-[acyl-carrier-protein] synthase III
MAMQHDDGEGGRVHHDFDVRGDEITATAIDLIERAVMPTLDTARLGVSEVDFVLSHQPNGEIFRLLTQRLGVLETQTVPVYPDAGSLGAASVPLSLDRLYRCRTVSPGARILLTAVGSGTAYGAILHQVGP